MATPAVEWEVHPAAQHQQQQQQPPPQPLQQQRRQHDFPSSHATPVAPRFVGTQQAQIEESLREQMWSGLGNAAPPARSAPASMPTPPSFSNAATPPHPSRAFQDQEPQQHQHAPASSRTPAAQPSPISSPQSQVQELANPSPSLPPPPPAEEGLPFSYVVVSAFFLAIAALGFGVYLAFEVISL